jgi:enterochelin esterase family protein
MANSLKIRGYDYNFIMHVGNHNQIGGTVALPETLTWLWRGYDATKTAQEFEQDAAEKEQPVWQVLELNRK